MSQAALNRKLCREAFESRESPWLQNLSSEIHDVLEAGDGYLRNLRNDESEWWGTYSLPEAASLYQDLLKFSRTRALEDMEPLAREGVDTERIEARFENGVLYVAVAKSQPTKAREINIDDGSSTQQSGGFFSRLVHKSENKA